MSNAIERDGWRAKLSSLFGASLFGASLFGASPFGASPFVDREFFMRANGQVRFVTVSARLQKWVAATALGSVLALGAGTGTLAYFNWTAQAERAALQARAAKVASAQSRVNAYRDDLGAVAQDLAKRQDFLEAVLPSLPDDLRQDDAQDAATPGTRVDGEAAAAAHKIGAALPEAGALARVEARQLAMVERLTRYADRRSNRATAAMRTLGLNPAIMVAVRDWDAMGGPLEELSSGVGDRVDPRFERLGSSLARMNALEASLDSIPQVSPTRGPAVSSSYGVRRDPFTGHAAMHSGLDFRGAPGAPIFAAAKGKVVFAGIRSGYGQVVEVSHGNGLMTRYAHMSRLGAHVGQAVEAGERIGAIGSTGRSTGPHLHFEVRVNGRAVNPRLFLEKAPHVLEEARREPDARDARQG